MPATNVSGHQGEYTQLAAVAERYSQAGDRAKAARFYRLASERALAAFANEEALRLLNEALARTQDAQLHTRFGLLLAREELYALMGKPERQVEDLTSLSTLADHLNDDGKRAIAAVRHAAYREITGDYPAAIAIAQLSTRLTALTKNPAAEAMGHFIWGKSLLRQGNYAAAKKQLAEALELAVSTFQQKLQADILRFLGVLANDQAQYAVATHHYDQALAIYQALGDQQGQANVLSNLGHIDQAQRKLAGATQHWEAAHKIFTKVGDSEGSVRILINLSAANLDLGFYDLARAQNEEALVTARETKLPLGECFALLNLGLISHYLDDNHKAETYLREALSVAETLGSKRMEGHALSVLGHALVEQGRIGDAMDVYWEAVSIWEDLGLPNLIAETQSGMARAAVRQNDQEFAKICVNAIVARLKHDPRLDGAESPARIYLTCYRHLSAAGDERALPLLSQGADIVRDFAAALDNDATQQSFLQNVAANRELLALAQAHTQ